MSKIKTRKCKDIPERSNQLYPTVGLHYLLTLGLSWATRDLLFCDHQQKIFHLLS